MVLSYSRVEAVLDHLVLALISHLAVEDEPVLVSSIVVVAELHAAADEVVFALGEAGHLGVQHGGLEDQVGVPAILVLVAVSVNATWG